MTVARIFVSFWQLSTIPSLHPVRINSFGVHLKANTLIPFDLSNPFMASMPFNSRIMASINRYTCILFLKHPIKVSRTRPATPWRWTFGVFPSQNILPRAKISRPSEKLSQRGLGGMTGLSGPVTSPADSNPPKIKSQPVLITFSLTKAHSASSRSSP